MRHTIFLLTMVSLAATPAAAEFATQIEELVVTARKREEPLYKTPVSVSAFTADDIRNFNASSLQDLARFTPGFSLDAGTGRQISSYRPVMRGQTTLRNGIANTSAVTTFIDGVYIGGSVQPTELYNLQRVEILRGPQAAQYGRGTYAGAINYITRAPGTESEGEVSVSVAEHDSHAFTAWRSGPLSPTLGYFLGGGYRDYEGEYRNRLDNQYVGDERQADLTGKLHWEPTDNLQLSWRLGWQRTDDGHFAASLQSSELNNCCFRSAEAPRARGYYVGIAPDAPPVELATDLLGIAGGSGVESERWLSSLTVTLDLASGITFTSITGLVDDSLERGFDLSYANYDPLFPFNPGAFTLYEEIEQRDFSQEFRFQSDDSGVWHWSAGLYGYRGTLEDRKSSRVYRDFSSETIVAPSLAPLSEEKIENLAVFGSLERDLGSAWTVGVELRWATDRVELKNRVNDGSGTVNGIYHKRWNNLSPRFTALYRASDNVSLYANIARGTKPGDFNPETSDERYREVREESVWTYELGLKGAINRKTSYALSVYQSEIDDQQLTTLVELDDGRSASLLTNAGRSRVQGLEAELSVAATEHMNLRFSYSWTDAEFRDYISNEHADLLGSDGSLASNNALGDVSGNWLPRVPEHMISAALDYTKPLSNGAEAYSSADWSFDSSRYAQEHNFIESGHRSLVNLRAGYRTGNWDLSLWVRNLLDDDTPADITRYLDRRTETLTRYPQEGPRASTSPRGFVITLPKGKQIGATLKYEF